MSREVFIADTYNNQIREVNASAISRHRRNWYSYIL